MAENDDHCRYEHERGGRVHAILNPGHSGSVLNCPHPSCEKVRREADDERINQFAAAFSGEFTVIDVTYQQRRALLIATDVLDRFITADGLLLVASLPGIAFKACPAFRPDHNGECLNCDEPASEHE